MKTQNLLKLSLIFGNGLIIYIIYYKLQFFNIVHYKINDNFMMHLTLLMCILLHEAILLIIRRKRNHNLYFDISYYMLFYSCIFIIGNYYTNLTVGNLILMLFYSTVITVALIFILVFFINNLIKRRLGMNKDILSGILLILMVVIFNREQFHTYFIVPLIFSLIIINSTVTNPEKIGTNDIDIS